MSEFIHLIGFFGFSLLAARKFTSGSLTSYSEWLRQTPDPELMVLTGIGSRQCNPNVRPISAIDA